MTFKHAKFEDSPVMRSLERLEKQKNPDSSDVFTKVASRQTDFSPTDSLVENILHLCAGLKQSGFDKHAQELEANFIRYKQAQTLYETSPEKGEDLVEFAHGKSHKLEDVDSDMAVFYTIVDKQLEAIKMIDKTPTGKLASSRDIINAVKIVFAQDANSQVAAYANSIIGKLKELRVIWENESGARKLFTSGFNWDTAIGNWNQLIKDPSPATLGVAVVNTNQIYNALSPEKSGTIILSVSESAWAEMKGLFSDIYFVFLPKIRELINKSTKKSDDSVIPESNVSQLSRIKNIKAKLNSWRAASNVASNKAALAYIKQQSDELDRIAARYAPIIQDADLSEEDKKSAILRLKAEIDKEMVDVMAFQKTWKL
jgi:hypothetical protein